MYPINKIVTSACYLAELLKQLYSDFPSLPLLTVCVLIVLFLGGLFFFTILIVSRVLTQKHSH